MRALRLHVDKDGNLSIVSAHTADFNDLRGFYNPEGYATMRVTGAARPGDGRVCVRAGLGDMDSDAGKADFKL